MKKMTLFAGLLCLFSTGCGTMGARVKVDTTGFTFSRSRVNVYNNAGPTIVAQPFSRGDGFVTEYKLGEKDPWCLWLCRKKIPTKLLALRHGEHASIPMMLNFSGQYVQESIGLLIMEINRKTGEVIKKIGTYSYCIDIPPDRPTVQDVHFGPRELRELKNGDPGEPCRRGYW